MMNALSAQLYMGSSYHDESIDDDDDRPRCDILMIDACRLHAESTIDTAESLGPCICSIDDHAYVLTITIIFMMMMIIIIRRYRSCKRLRLFLHISP